MFVLSFSPWATTREGKGQHKSVAPISIYKSIAQSNSDQGNSYQK